MFALLLRSMPKEGFRRSVSSPSLDSSYDKRLSIGGLVLGARGAAVADEEADEDPEPAAWVSANCAKFGLEAVPTVGLRRQKEPNLGEVIDSVSVSD